ncbi:hypothetical protein ABLE93_25955 [Xanthobacter sp. KR7-65]|uniref:hypothetical protein n=1 Tax=Xanthobacter sp. KR7-65 TaxID=3156612 RepID=UPI0032B56FA6
MDKLPRSRNKSDVGAAETPIGFWGGALLFAGLAQVFFDIFSGALRFALAGWGLEFLIYIVPLSLTGITTSYIVIRAFSSSHYVLVSAFFIFYILYSIWMGLDVEVCIFAYYTLGAFLLGFLLAERGELERFFKLALYLLMVASFGVFLNSLIEFPWIGMSYYIAGIQVDAARQWSTFGISRLAGFSKSSTVVGIQITILVLIVMTMRYAFFIKASVWIVSIYAAILTTSKTSLVIVLVGPVLMFCFQVAKRLNGGILARRYVFTTIFIGLSLVIIPPFATEFFSRSSLIASNLTEYVEFFRLDSLADRGLDMWPRAFMIVTEHDMRELASVLGAGLGSIGAGSSLKLSASSNSADNIFVYLNVSFGLFAYLILAGLLLGWNRFDGEDQEDNICYALVMGALLIGVFVNGVESVFSGLALGAGLGRLLRQRGGVAGVDRLHNVSTMPRAAEIVR